MSTETKNEKPKAARAKAQHEEKKPVWFRIVCLNDNQFKPDEYGQNLAPDVTGHMPLTEAISMVRADIEKRMFEGGWGVEWNHMEVWDDGDERYDGCETDERPMRCRVYNFDDEDRFAKDLTKAKISLVYWLMPENEDGTLGTRLPVEER